MRAAARGVPGFVVAEPIAAGLAGGRPAAATRHNGLMPAPRAEPLRHR